MQRLADRDRLGRFVLAFGVVVGVAAAIASWYGLKAVALGSTGVFIVVMSIGTFLRSSASARRG